MTEDGASPSILTEIYEEPDAIRATVEKCLPVAAELRQRFRPGSLRRVFLTGNGTSLYSCEFAANWYRAVAEPGDPVVVVLPAGELLHHPPTFGPDDVVLALSASGEHRDVLRLAKRLRDQVPVVGITQAADSSLGRTIDVVVEAAGGRSHVPVMTKTFASSASATVLATLALAADTSLDTVGSALTDAAGRAESAIAAAATTAERLGDELAGFAHGFVFGTGGSVAAAREAALKLKEMAVIHTEGDATWEVESGSAIIIDERSFVVALRTEGPGSEATERLSQLSGEWGARVVEVASEPATDGSTLLPVPPGTPDLVAPLVLVPPVVMVAFHLAQARGLDPNRPDWPERYARQGLNHVVGSEGGS